MHWCMLFNIFESYGHRTVKLYYEGQSKSHVYKLLSLYEGIMNSIVTDRFLDMTLINFECFFAKHLVRMSFKWSRFGIDLDTLS